MKRLNVTYNLNNLASKPVKQILKSRNEKDKCSTNVQRSKNCSGFGIQHLIPICIEESNINELENGLEYTLGNKENRDKTKLIEQNVGHDIKIVEKNHNKYTSIISGNGSRNVVRNQMGSKAKTYDEKKKKVSMADLIMKYGEELRAQHLNASKCPETRNQNKLVQRSKGEDIYRKQNSINRHIQSEAYKI